MIMYPMFLILSLFVSTVQMQRWGGKYAWDDNCNARYCCCYAGTLSVANSGSNLVFTSDTKGCGSSTSSSTFSNPDGYSFSATGTRGARITYTLSGDSNTLTVQNNDYSYCGGSAKRTSIGKRLYPSIISLVIMLAGIWIVP